MRHVKHKKGKDRVAATILLCFCLIALTSIFTIQSSIDKVNKSAQNLRVDQKIATQNGPESQESASKDTEAQSDTDKTAEIDRGAADLPVNKEIPVVDSAAQDASDSLSGSGSYLPPVSLSTATVSKKYSMDMVIYNKTLDQYMTHPGMDLEAPIGSGVNAIADGTVTDVYEDDAYGTAIEITHDNGLVSKYASLESSALVEKGDTVSQGQQIGAVGKTALYESMDTAHLHFEVYKDGRLCNPADLITFE